MKKVLCLVFAVVSLLLVSATYAQDDGKQSVLVNPPAVAAPVAPAEIQVQTGWLVAPIVRSYRVVPAPVFIAQPVKPIFKTPVRDSIYSSIYCRRVSKWNQLNRKLNVVVATPVVPQ